MILTITIDEKNETIVISDGKMKTQAEGYILFVATEGVTNFVSCYGNSEAIAYSVGDAYGTALGEKDEEQRMLLKVFKRMFDAIRYIRHRLGKEITIEELEDEGTIH